MNVVKKKKNREVVKSEPICAKNTCKTDLWLVSRYLVGSPMLVEGQIELGRMFLLYIIYYVA